MSQSSVRQSYVLYLCWFLALILVVGITLSFESETTKFYGIAESREVIVNSEAAVDIKRISVVEGQSIQKGDLLVELDSPDLTFKINQISHQLDQLKAQKSVNLEELKSKINQLEALKRSKNSEIKYQIVGLQNQYNINRELTAKLKSISLVNKNQGKTKVKSPIQVKIESLKKELSFNLNQIDLQINLLKKSLDLGKSPIKIQVEKLQKELELLQKEKEKLFIYASLTGIIGSVNYKVGEKIAPFAAILTLHTKSPSYIKGYIHENVYNQVSMNNEVKIQSLTDSKNKISGIVVGVGSRIVSYPARLRKRADIQMWGRELMIKIPEKNNFLLGEKVLIRSLDSQKKSPFDSILKLFSPKKAHSKKLPAKIKTQAVLIDINPKNVVTGNVPIEASGALYLKDLKQFIIISDETDKKKPKLFLMNGQGQIIDEILIKGLKKINDMEAITLGQNNEIFIASSQSFNKKGKEKKSRKLLIKVKRNGKDFSLVHKINLFALLQDGAQRFQDQKWAQYIKRSIADKSIDIEGIFYLKRDLYLGFKRPFLEGKSPILKLKSIDKVIAGAKLEKNSLEIWNKLDLRHKKTNSPTGISDLIFHEGELYVLSYKKIKQNHKKQKLGFLWAYDIKNNKLRQLKKFKDLKPEGLTFNPHKKEFLISFDQGEDEASKIMKLNQTDFKSF